MTNQDTGAWSVPRSVQAAELTRGYGRANIFSVLGTGFLPPPSVEQTTARKPTASMDRIPVD
jgi:hypothetical protein